MNLTCLPTNANPAPSSSRNFWTWSTSPDSRSRSRRPRRAARQEVEKVGVFQGLLGQVGLRRWKGSGEIADGLSLAAVEIAFDLHREDGSAPAVLQGLRRVPQPLSEVLQFEERDCGPTESRPRGAAGRFPRNLSQAVTELLERFLPQPDGQAARPNLSQLVTEL